MSREDRTRKWLVFISVLWLAACGPKTPDADDWRLGARVEGVITEAMLPRPPADDLTGTVMGRPVYLITEQALYFPVVVEMQQHIYRYDIAARKGHWQESMPAESAAGVLGFQTDQLFGSSDALRQRERPPEPILQPFGDAAIHLEQQETGYSHSYYNVGFPFGDSGWVTEDYGDGALELSAGTPSATNLLLSQSYRVDNYPFTAGWSPDGRYVLVLEMLESASYYRKRKGHSPSLRFAVFGPYAVEKTEAEILAFHARVEKERKQRQLDSQLRQGLIAPEDRYGAFYEELLRTIQSCPALLAVTGPVEALTLKPGQTLGLSDGRGDEDGKYFTFELRAARGNGTLHAAAFYLQTPERVRQEIIGRITPYDLFFNGKNHYFDDCEAP